MYANYSSQNTPPLQPKSAITRSAHRAISQITRIILFLCLFGESTANYNRCQNFFKGATAMAP